MVKYDVGAFRYPAHVMPGDIFTMHLRAENPDGTFQEQNVSTDILITQTITHWVMFYAPGIGFGGMFGGPDIEAKLPEVLVNPVRTKEGESIFS